MSLYCTDHAYVDRVPMSVSDVLNTQFPISRSRSRSLPTFSTGVSTESSLFKCVSIPRSPALCTYSSRHTLDLYYTAFPNDRWGSKALVYLVYVLELLQTIILTRDAYITWGINFSNIEILDEQGLTWFGVPVLTAIGMVLSSPSARAKSVSHSEWSRPKLLRMADLQIVEFQGRCSRCMGGKLLPSLLCASVLTKTLARPSPMWGRHSTGNLGLFPQNE